MITTNQMIEFIKEVAQYTMNTEFQKTKGFRRIAPMFWGPQGSGKTEGQVQASSELFIPAINLRLSQYPPEDFGIPRIGSTTYDGVVDYFIDYAMPKFFPQYEIQNGEKVKRRRLVTDSNGNESIEETNEYRIDFKRLRKHISNYDYLDAYYTSKGLDINDAPGATLLLDELTRITDQNLFQMIFQLPENYGLRDYKVPDGISIFAASNPPSANYQTSSFFDDHAFSNRFIHFVVKPDIQSFLSHHKTEEDLSSRVMAFCEATPKFITPEDLDLDLEEIVNRSFRTPKYLNIFDTFIQLKDPDLEFQTFAGILGPIGAASFISHREQWIPKAVQAIEIMYEYDDFDLDTMHWREAEPISKVRKRIIESRYENSEDFYNEAIENLVAHLSERIIKESNYEKVMLAAMPKIARFLFDLPHDMIMRTLGELCNHKDKAIADAINHVIISYEPMHLAMERLHDAIEKGKDEVTV